jgi:hypothetical protein
MSIIAQADIMGARSPYAHAGLCYLQYLRDAHKAKLDQVCPELPKPEKPEVEPGSKPIAAEFAGDEEC